jgi:hypothetical protein
MITLTTNQSKLPHINTTEPTSLQGHHQHSPAAADIAAAATAGHQQRHQPTVLASKLRHTLSTLNQDSTELKISTHTIDLTSQSDTATPSTLE